MDFLILTTGRLHYIGYTSDKEKRYNEHCYKKSGTKEKRIWIAQLKKQKLKPIIKVIKEYLTAGELPIAEEFWYGYCRMIGAELYNDPDWIGKGSRKGRLHTEETKVKMREKRKGKKPMQGKSHSEETKIKIGKTNKGMVSIMKGKHHSDETKQKISNRLKGRVSERNGKTWKVVNGQMIWFDKPNTPKGMQQCTDCCEIKSIENFSFTNAKHTKYKNKCKSCINAMRSSNTYSQ